MSRMGIFHTISQVLRLPHALAAAVATPVGLAGPGTLRGLIGLDDSLGQAVTTRSEALTIPAVLRGRNLLSTTVARTPLVCDGPTPMFVPIASPLGAMTLQTPFHRMLATADDLLFNGVACWALDRDDNGTCIGAIHIPLEMWHLEENTIRVNGKAVDPLEVCIFAGIHAGLLTHSCEAFTDARNLARAAARVAQNPAALIELRQTNNAQLSEEHIEHIINRYIAARKGRNSGVGFSSAGLEVHEHEMAKENLLIDGRNAAAVDIARAMNVPAAFIDATVGGTSLSYQNAASRMTELVTFGVEPLMSAIEARLNQPDMHTGYLTDPIRFDPTALLDAIPTTPTIGDSHGENSSLLP